MFSKIAFAQEITKRVEQRILLHMYIPTIPWLDPGLCGSAPPETSLIDVSRIYFMSRAVFGRDAGPRLRSSYSRSVVASAGLCPHADDSLAGLYPLAHGLREERDEIGLTFS
jgi:hypothetical protein